MYIGRMFCLRPRINQSIHYLRLYRSLYSNNKLGPDGEYQLLLAGWLPGHVYATDILSYLIRILTDSVQCWNIGIDREGDYGLID